MFNLNEGLFYFLFNGKETDWRAYLTYISFILITILSAYFLGSINSAIIFSKVVYHDDIRKHGSGNGGMTNMLRTFGLGAAGLTLAGDLLKTVISISVAGVLFGFNYVGGISCGTGFCYVAGFFAVIGHVFPIYYKFKGGKGVLATATMALVLTPVPFAILLLLFIAIVAISKYVSLGSVTVAILYPVLVHGYFTVTFPIYEKSTPGFTALTTILLAIFIVWSHRENLKRISNRTERKISFKKKEKRDE
ncbi:MAG: glycerol-3-phosphate 1-O-acyltransferase PlsY [Clostridia bacterium]|nr:glycerol-3-phosphate 1-O-acyltransferase PlsY [Clostridia bacterium]